MLQQFLQQLADTPPIQWLAMVTGIVGVWLSIKEKVGAWPLFIICYCSYVYISYDFGLHAFMGMNVVFIGISAYGWAKWKSEAQGDAAELPITQTTKAHWSFVAAFLLIATVGIGWILSLRGEAKIPYLDAFAMSCGFTAQWMLSRKQIETWFFWIVSDIIYLGIFISGQSWPSVILFSAFIGLAIKGWKEWQRQLA